MNEGCSCGERAPASRRRVVLTGGPGAGKTATLEVVRRQFREHVDVLHEAASIVFGGGFPRRSTAAARRCAQVAIFRVQEQLEALAEAEGTAALTLCDRGVLDGLAYWPDGPTGLLAEVGRERAAVLAGYDMVIHLRTPREGEGYDHHNPLRTEDAEEAREIDDRITAAWAGHPNIVVVPSSMDFRVKLDRVLGLLRAQLPSRCCERLDALGPSATDLER